MTPINTTFTGTVTIGNTRQGPPKTQSLSTPITFTQYDSKNDPYNWEISDVVITDALTTTGLLVSVSPNGSMSMNIILLIGDSQQVIFNPATYNTIGENITGIAASGSMLTENGDVTLVGSGILHTIPGEAIGMVISGNIAPPLPPVFIEPPATPIKVPYISGMLTTEAGPRIYKVGLIWSITEVELGEDRYWGRVISQNPPGGTTILTGSTVIVRVGTKKL